MEKLFLPDFAKLKWGIVSSDTRSEEEIRNEFGDPDLVLELSLDELNAQKHMDDMAHKFVPDKIVVCIVVPMVLGYYGFFSTKSWVLGPFVALFACLFYFENQGYSEPATWLFPAATLIIPLCLGASNFMRLKNATIQNRGAYCVGRDTTNIKH